MTNGKRFFYRKRVLFNMLPIAVGLIVFYLTPSRQLSGGTLASGLVILWIGFLYRAWVSSYNWSNLNSTQPEAKEGIITAGPYARCRNPIYLSAILLVTGFSIIFNWWLVTLLMVIPTILLHLWQIQYEEQYLQNLWPEDFLEYKKKVPCLIPHLFKKADLQPHGNPNWKKVIQNDTGLLTGVMTFVLVTLILMPFVSYGRGVLAMVLGITAVTNIIIVSKVQSGKNRNPLFITIDGKKWYNKLIWRKK